MKIRNISAPTEVDHYQLTRVMDVYVAPKKEDLGKVAGQIDDIIAKTKLPEGVRVKLRGSVQGMRASFRSFAVGLILSVVLVYLVLVAQFASWTDPLIILLAVPPGLAGVLLFLLVTGTTLNVMSLMGVVMMVGIVVSNSILIVEFARHLHKEGKPFQEAVAPASRQTAATNPDDLAGHPSRTDPHGLGHRGRKRGLCAAGTRDYRRPAGVRRSDRVSRTRCLSSGASRRASTGGGVVKGAIPSFALFLAMMGANGAAQEQASQPPAQTATAPSTTAVRELTIEQAEATGLRSNPQITVGKLQALQAHEYVREARAALLPQISVNLTGVGAEPGGRLSAGYITDGRIYPRVAGGITKIVTQLRGGADFAKLAEQYSEDAASKAAGGDFGVIKASSDYPAELKSAVFALKPGEISEPIRQPTAFYIVRLEEKGPQPVDEIREPIVHGAPQ